ECDVAEGVQSLTPDHWPLTTAVGAGPVNLSRRLVPNKRATAYGYTEITSDRERDVCVYIGSDQRFTFWLNGSQVYRRNVYRAAAPDEDCVTVTLKEGANTVLIKTECGWEGWAFYFRLGDEYGMPATDGIQYRFSHR
ncbi:MAG: hypothetical protein FWF84_02985, partial [Kiritimatiellaeota bacterium]|nr:hypothetical protein [Kiritimatiellota bacterium]